MLVLGIESSCDETGCAIVSDGKEILSNVVMTQEELHRVYGGVIPELACRRHVDILIPLLTKTLDQAKIDISQVELIAVAHGPGLIGALLIGLNFAKGLSLALNKPFVGVNHVEAHLYSVLMEHTPLLPALGVVISGGHTALIEITAIGKYKTLGQTQDDAVGEAFDKVAKLLDLPYPGGPEVERLAQKGDPLRYPFKGGHVKTNPLNLSFSGLKTAVLYAIRGQNGSKEAPTIIQEEDKADIAASFQYAVCSYLAEKILFAVQQSHYRSLILGGGVTQNRYLRQFLEKKIPCPLFWPPPGLSLDNAAMIAGLGYHIFLQNGPHQMDHEAQTRIKI